MMTIDIRSAEIIESEAVSRYPLVSSYLEENIFSIHTDPTESWISTINKVYGSEAVLTIKSSTKSCSQSTHSCLNE